MKGFFVEVFFLLSLFWSWITERFDFTSKNRCLCFKTRVLGTFWKPVSLQNWAASGHFHLKTSTERGPIRQKKPGKPLENLLKRDVSKIPRWTQNPGDSPPQTLFMDSEFLQILSVLFFFGSSSSSSSLLSNHPENTPSSIKVGNLQVDELVRHSRSANHAENVCLLYTTLYCLLYTTLYWLYLHHLRIQ